jgi:hypothetical protein
MSKEYAKGTTWYNRMFSFPVVCCFGGDVKCGPVQLAFKLLEKWQVINAWRLGLLGLVPFSIRLPDVLIRCFGCRVCVNHVEVQTARILLDYLAFGWNCM